MAPTFTVKGVSPAFEWSGGTKETELVKGAPYFEMYEVPTSEASTSTHLWSTTLQNVRFGSGWEDYNQKSEKVFLTKSFLRGSSITMPAAGVVHEDIVAEYHGAWAFEQSLQVLSFEIEIERRLKYVYVVPKGFLGLRKKKARTEKWTPVFKQIISITHP